MKFNREASNATKNTKLARVKPARDRDRVGCFIPHLFTAVQFCCRDSRKTENRLFFTKLADRLSSESQ